MKKLFLKIAAGTLLVGSMAFNIAVSDKQNSSEINLLNLISASQAAAENSCCIGSTFRISSIPGGWRCDQGGNSCCPIC